MIFSTSLQILRRVLFGLLISGFTLYMGQAYPDEMDSDNANGPFNPDYVSTPTKPPKLPPTLAIKPGGTWKVELNDTLYSISRVLFPGDIGKQAKLRRDIRALNPKIFQNGAKSMKVGTLLKLPDYVSQHEAKPESLPVPTAALAPTVIPLPTPPPPPSITLPPLTATPEAPAVEKLEAAPPESPVPIGTEKTAENKVSHPLQTKQSPVKKLNTEPHIHGRIYVDAQAYNHATTPLANTIDISAARISLSGWTTLEWRYFVQYDLANRSLKDALIAYQPDKDFRVKLGQFQEPFSLEELTSSRFITFIERGLPNALAPGYHVGVGLARSARHWSAALGAFGEPAGSKVSSTGGNAGWGVTGRWTLSPLNRYRQLLHFGLSATYRAAGTGGTLRIREAPETGFSNMRYLNTGTLSDVGHHASAGVELAGVAGPLSLQGEFIETQVSRYGGAETLRFKGSYGYVSWFASGESRPFKRDGTFGRIQPRSKRGAVELAARYSMLNLNSGTVYAGKEEDTTVGLNWYLNDHTRLMANYVMVLARTTAGTQTPNIFLARFQLDF